jgi:hypothetical protein
MRNYYIVLLNIILLGISCSPSHFVRPLKKSEQAANISIGGPLIKYGTNTIPIPFIVANYAYGIDSTFTTFAGFNITSALFGNFQTDIGFTKQLLKQNHLIPSISVSPLLNLLYRDQNAKKLYPQLDINAYWEYGKNKNYFYVGINNWFELSSKRAFDQPQKNRWIYSPQIGHCISNRKWDFIMEAKIIAPAISNQKIIVEYQTPLNNSGAFGLYLSINRKF